MKKKPIQLTFHGKPFNLLSATNRTEQLIVEYLDKLPDGTLTDTDELASYLKYTTRGIREYSPGLIKRGYVIRVGHKNLFGNPRTIQEVIRVNEAG